MPVPPQPQSKPTAGTTAPRSMDDRLQALFAAKHDQKEPTFESALTTTAADLKAAKDAASSEFETVPQILLDEEQCSAMAGKRYPGLSTVTRLMAHGLARHPEIVDAILVTPELALALIAHEDAVTDLAIAGDKIRRGADDGSILASATTETLCQRALEQVQQARTDPRTPQGQRYALHTAFVQPERLRAERLQRLQETKAQNQQASQGPAQQTDQALQTAAETRLVHTFGAAIKNQQ